MKKKVTKADITKYLDDVKERLLKLDNSKDLEPQDVFLEIRIIWESLQSSLYDRKSEGHEKVLKNLSELAFTSTYAALYIDRHMKDERAKQLGIEEKETKITLSDKKSDPKSKQKKKRGPVSLFSKNT